MKPSQDERQKDRKTDRRKDGGAGGRTNRHRQTDRHTYK